MDSGESELSPVVELGGIVYKRDDLFQPFGPSGVNGGKVRQAISIIEHNKDYIREECGGVVISPTSVHSPQGSNITMVAREFGFDCLCAVGGPYNEENKNKILKHPHMKFSILNGGKVLVVCKHGMNNVIFARIKKYVQNNPAFIMQFGFYADTNPDYIVDPIANQCQNIPDELDYLLVPTGSGIHMASVVYGLNKYGKKVKEIIAVGVGPDRSKSINNILVNMKKPELVDTYKFVSLYDSIPYAKHIVEKFGDTDEEMDPIYEGKAHQWMKKNIDMKKKICFWSVGKRQSDEKIEDMCKDIPEKEMMEKIEFPDFSEREDVSDLFE